MNDSLGFPPDFPAQAAQDIARFRQLKTQLDEFSHVCRGIMDVIGMPPDRSVLEAVNTVLKPQALIQSAMATSVIMIAVLEQMEDHTIACAVQSQGVSLEGSSDDGNL